MTRRAASSAGDLRARPTTNLLAWVLPDAAAALYLQLLAEPDTSVSERGVAVEQLLSSGFAIRRWDDADKLLPVAPEIAINRAIAQQATDWAAARPDIEAAVTAVDALARVHRHGGLEATTPLDAGEDRQNAAITHFLSARKQVCLMQPYPRWMPDEIRDDAEASDVATPPRPGVIVRLLYDDEILADPDFRKLAIEEVELGAQARVAPTLPMWMQIVDSTSVLYLPDPKHPIGAVSESPALVAALQLAFESVWTTARPLSFGNSAELSPALQETLMMLLNGKTNKGISQTLRLNERTVRRRINDLCAHFGVDDRTTLMAVALAERDRQGANTGAA